MRLLFTSIYFLVAFSLYGQSTVGPEISIDNTVYDFGTIFKGASAIANYRITNTGDEPLIISSCKSSCGCLIPQCDKDPIMPGNSISISAKYDSKRIGRMNKMVTIYSNALNEPQIVVFIAGEVIIDSGGNYQNVINKSEATKNPTIRLQDNIRIRVSDNRVDISKVAVIGKESTLCDGTKDDGQGLAELVEGELLGLYGVVERKYLEEILDEQRLAMSGLLFEDTDFATAGCLAGAQGTVLASYGCLQGKTKLQVKLVDCSTSDLYWSATGLDVSEFDLLDALRSKLE